MSSPDDSEALLMSVAEFLRCQFGTLEEAFSALDTEGLQRLNAASFAKSLPRLGCRENADEVFRTLDADGLNSVTLQVFMQRLGGEQVASSGNVENRLHLVERSQQLMTKLLGDMNRQLETFSSTGTSKQSQATSSEISDNVRNEVGDVCQKILESCHAACASTAQSAKSACAKLDQQCRSLEQRVSSTEVRLGSTEGLLAAQVSASEDTEPSTRVAEPDERSIQMQLVESLVSEKIALASKDNRALLEEERQCVSDKMEVLTQEFDKLAESRAEVLAMVSNELQAMRSGCMDMSGVSVSFAEADANSSRPNAEFLWEGGGKRSAREQAPPKGLDQVKLLWEAVQGAQRNYELLQSQVNELRRGVESQPSWETLQTMIDEQKIGRLQQNAMAAISESQVMPDGDTQTVKYVQESVRATQLQLEALRLNLHELMKDTSLQNIRDLHEEVAGIHQHILQDTSMQSIRDLYEQVGGMQQQVKDVPRLQKQVADLPSLIADLPSMRGLCSLHEVVASMQQQIRDLEMCQPVVPPEISTDSRRNAEVAMNAPRQMMPLLNRSGSSDGVEGELDAYLGQDETRLQATPSGIQCTPGAASSKNLLLGETTPSGPARRRAVSPVAWRLNSPMADFRSIADELAATSAQQLEQQRRSRTPSQGPRQGPPASAVPRSPSPMQDRLAARRVASPQPSFGMGSAEDVVLARTRPVSAKAPLSAPRPFNSYSAPVRPVSPLQELRPVMATPPSASGCSSATFPTGGLARSPSQPGTMQALMKPQPPLQLQPSSSSFPARVVGY